MEEKRKASKSRIYWLNKRDIEEIGGLLFPDEEFRPVKGESAIWISNYARVLSKRKGKPRILSWNDIFFRHRWITAIIQWWKFY